MIYDYSCNCCGLHEEIELSVERRDAWVNLPCANCDEGILLRNISAPHFVVKGANAANGYSTNVADIEKRLGREVNNNDWGD
jgi:predicted nucleic acid-binding Zn ribbon protein